MNDEDFPGIYTETQRKKWTRLVRYVAVMGALAIGATLVLITIWLNWSEDSWVGEEIPVVDVEPSAHPGEGNLREALPGEESQGEVGASEVAQGEVSVGETSRQEGMQEGAQPSATSAAPSSEKNEKIDAGLVRSSVTVWFQEWVAEHQNWWMPPHLKISHLRNHEVEVLSSMPRRLGQDLREKIFVEINADLDIPRGNSELLKKAGAIYANIGTGDSEEKVHIQTVLALVFLPEHRMLEVREILTRAAYDLQSNP